MKTKIGLFIGFVVPLSFLLSAREAGSENNPAVVSPPFSDAALLEIRDGFEARRDTAFEQLRGSPLKIAAQRPPLGPGRTLYTRHYSWSIIDFAFKVFWLEETDQYAAANDALIANCTYYIGSRKARDDRDSFYWSADELVRLVEFFGDNGSRTPGLISPECKAKILEMMWLYAKSTSKIEDAEYVNSKTWHVHESENHHIQRFSTVWHFSKFLRNEPAYRDRPYDDGHTAAEHFHAWTAYNKAWLAERAKKGLLIEMANGGYGMETLKCVYNFHDFGDDELGVLSGKFLDLYWAAWAQEQIGEVRGGAKSRIYQGGRARSGKDTLGYLTRYYTGVKKPEKLSRAMFTVVTSDYRMPLVVLDMALDPAGRGNYEIVQRAQGLVEAGFFGPPDYRMRTDGGGIVRYSYCTPEFILGTALVAARDSKDWAMISSQNRWQGVVFAGHPDARIFPQAKDDNDPNKGIVTYNQYWSVQSKGTLITQKLPISNINLTGKIMCVWFSKAGRTGNLYEQEGWVFAEYDGAYAAIKCVSGSYGWQDGEAKGRWMVCAEEFTPVIFEVARKADFAGFSDFQNKIVSLPLAFDGKILSYGGLGGDQFTFNADRVALPTVNGNPVGFAPPNVFDSPFIQSKYNSGVVEIHKDGRNLVLDFNDRESPR